MPESTPTLIDRPDPATPEITRPRGAGTGLFRAMWRWHFYAAFLVIPVFAMLAVTGLIMLFKWQLDPLQAPELRFTPPPTGSMAPMSAQEQAVRVAFPGATITAAQTGVDDRSAYFTITTAQEETRNVYVNPYTAEVLGSRDPRDLVSNIATEIHGMILFGTPSDTRLFGDPINGEDFTVGSIGDRIIETATCWAIVMALTGYFVYWRGRDARLARRAKRVAGAVTRSRHARIGALAGVPILLMVLTALPWTGLFGHTFQRLATGSSLSLWGEDPGASSTLGETIDDAGSTSVPAPWAEGAAVPPASEMPAGHNHGGSSAVATTLSIDRVMAAAQQDGLPAPYYITYPADAEGVYSVMSDMWHDKASAAYDDVSQERVVHVDQYSGQIAGRYSYAEYTPLAKLVSQGIAIHEGQRFGSLSFWLSAAFCVGVLFLCVTGPVMWWRRRNGGLSAPRGAMPIMRTPWLIAVLVVLGLALPLFGVTLVAVLLIDRFVVRRSERMSRALNTVPLG